MIENKHCSTAQKQFLKTTTKATVPRDNNNSNSSSRQHMVAKVYIYILQLLNVYQNQGPALSVL